MKKLIYISVSALTLVSCSGVKDLAKPDIELPASIVASESDSLSVADLAWWEFYGDPALRRIISRTLANNRDILASAAKVEELRQLYGVDKLNYLPVISGVVGPTNEIKSYDKEDISRDPQMSLKVNLSWEADLWGGLSNAQRSSGAKYIASVEDKRAMEMTLISEAATAYFNLIALENELEIVRQTLSTRGEALQKSRLRYEGGLTSELVYQQAKVEYSTTAALVPGLERRIQLAKNALNLLMGEFPETEFGIGNRTLDVSLPNRMPVGLPSQLLERRPDLRASEQRLKAAMADVGVAYSNRFPKLSISLTGGWENDEVAHLLKSPYTYLLGQVTGVIFDFGRKKRQYKASVAAYEQARFAYEQAVLSAFKEANDAAVTYKAMRETAERRAELRDAALKYVSLANKQYIAGTISYIDVLDAQRRYFDAQINLSNSVRDEYLAIIALYKALGGGWGDLRE